MTKKLPAGLAWPVTDAQLKASLGADMDRVRLHRVTFGSMAWDAPMVAEWRPPSGVTLRAFPVMAEEMARLGPAWAADGTPALVEWVRAALAATAEWAAEPHERRWLWQTDALWVSDDRGQLVRGRPLRDLRRR